MPRVGSSTGQWDIIFFLRFSLQIPPLCLSPPADPAELLHPPPQQSPRPPPWRAPSPAELLHPLLDEPFPVSSPPPSHTFLAELLHGLPCIDRLPVMEHTSAYLALLAPRGISHWVLAPAVERVERGNGGGGTWCRCPTRRREQHREGRDCQRACNREEAHGGGRAQFSMVVELNFRRGTRLPSASIDSAAPIVR